MASYTQRLMGDALEGNLAVNRQRQSRNVPGMSHMVATPATGGH